MSIIRSKIGNVIVSRIIEGGSDALPDEFFAGGMRQEIDRQRAWMDPSWFTSEGAPLMSVSAFVLSSAGKNVLVDSGLGTWPVVGGPERAPGPDFLTNLRGAGFEPEDIDVVAATHLHFDHVGGNTREGADGNVVPVFTRAQYCFGEDEWRVQSTPEKKGAPGLSSIDVAVRPLVESGRAQLVSSGFELLPGIRYMSTPGHTEGHMCVYIDSEGEAGVVTGDFAHHPFQITRPEIGSVFDDDCEISNRTRRSLVNEWAMQGVTILGTHFPGTGIGRLEKQTDGSVRYVEL